MDREIGTVGSSDVWLEPRGKQDCVSGDAGEGKEQDTLGESDKGEVEDEEDESRDFRLDNLPVVGLASHRRYWASARQQYIPSVVLRSNVVATATPVVVGQSYLDGTVSLTHQQGGKKQDFSHSRVC